MVSVRVHPRAEEGFGRVTGGRAGGCPRVDGEGGVGRAVGVSARRCSEGSRHHLSDEASSDGDNGGG
eukprot:3529530-Pleurochrysis_carterae.AAC.1